MIKVGEKLPAGTLREFIEVATDFAMTQPTYMWQNNTVAVSPSTDNGRRHINGVVSNGVVPKSQICKLVAKPAPEICIGSCFVPGCFTRQTSKV